MELRVLRYFLTAANEGNITRAADILHITQPTLSRQLTELEQELGTVLMIRGKRALTLTNDGLFFKRRAEEIVTLADKTEHEFIRKNDSVSGIISIGATEALGGQILADLMTQFVQKYPGVRFDLYNEMADNIKDQIDKGLIDIGLLLEPVDTEKYDFIRFPQKERWGVLLHQEDPLSSKKILSVQDIIHYPLILPRREKVYEQILSWLGCDESQLKIPATYTLLSNVALLVEHKMGCAVCLDGALSISHSPFLRFLPLLPERSTRSILIWKKSHSFSPAISLFIQMVNEQYAPE